MEAVPRMPMISFDVKVNTEIVSFGPKLKQYISSFYHEDPESYNNEIHTLETLRAAAVRPSMDVTGVQMLKKYFCQLHFLKSRFPMEDGQTCAVYFSWRDNYSNMVCSVPDVDFELMNILYDIGAVHSKLGAEDCRVTPEGMKMACTHFQCAAWAFQTVRETYPQMVSLVLAPEVIHFMHLTCLAQAQECILEKSMMDNRKATIIAKVAVQVVEYYKQALTTLQTTVEEGSLSDLLGSRTYKDWIKYLNFKVAYHKAIALLYQGQQAEEQQKMGERVAFYQAASDQLQEACKRASNLSHQQDVGEALSFTGDVIEGKKKAAKNENEFIYHEDVPEKDALQEVKGASLVKGIAFNVNDAEVSGPDIFSRLVPMEAHEASSVYSEQKAQMLRQLGERVESKDRALAEFMSSMQLDCLTQMKQASGLTIDLVDRAAAMSARPTAIKDLVDAMAKLSNTYHDVEAMLNEIGELLKDEENKEQDYLTQMGNRPPSIIATDLTREFTKYQEAHSKASDSNQNLHRAMTTHIANLKILALPLTQLKEQIPSVELPTQEVNEEVINELEALLSKVEEMKNQRSLLWAQLHDAVKNDDITSLLVTRTLDQNLDQLFQQELQKHQKQAALLDQNMAAQENILKALIDTYARFTNTRRYLQDVISKRSMTLSALTNSYDTYEDLLSKANKGLEFYNKLETNVTKLLQRIKSTCKVQDEEREQMLAKHNKKKVVAVVTPGPKLKDYLDAKADAKNVPVSEPITSSTYTAPASGMTDPTWPPAVRPAPLGSEMTTDSVSSYASSANEQSFYYYNTAADLNQIYNYNYAYVQPVEKNAEQDLSERMAALMAKPASTANPANSNQVYGSNLQNMYYQQPAEATSNYYSAFGSGANTSQTANMYNTPQSHNTTVTTYSTSMQPSTLPTQTMQQPANLPTQPIQQPAAYTYVQPEAYSNYMQPIGSYVHSGHYVDPAKATSESYSSVKPSQYVEPKTGDYSAGSNSYMQKDPSQAPPNVAKYGEPNASYVNPGNSGQYVDPTSYVQPNTYSQTTSDMYAAPTNYAQANSNFYTQTVTASTYPSNNPSQTVAYPSDASSNTYSTTNQVAASYPSTNTYAEGYYQYPPYNPAISNYCDAYSNQNTANYANYHSTQVSAATPQYYPPSTSGQNVSANAYPATSTTPAITATKEQSNIDLLSGLDFTISQAPLVPQQNKEKPEVPTKEVPVTKTIEQPVSSAKPASIKPDSKDAITVEKKHLQRNSFKDPEVIRQFTQEVEKFEKFVDLLSTKTLNGPTPLDLKWKEIQDKQDACQQVLFNISVARCYAIKNRCSDVMPYDQTRVKLFKTKDDYINASYVKDITPNSPLFIITQCPMQSTFYDFWIMVWEQQIEIVLCLLSDSEMKQDIYWPTNEQCPLSLGNLTIAVQSQSVKEHWIERLLCVNHLEQRSSRTIRHIQFTAWPSSLFPTYPSVIDCAKEILDDHKAIANPILVHCLAGDARSGLLCLLMAAATEVLINPISLPDLASVAFNLSSVRKSILRNREYLKFAYHAFLHFLRETRASQVRGQPSTEEPTVVPLQPQPNTPADDPLSMLDPLWASKKTT